MTLQDILALSMIFILGICFGIIIVVKWIKKYGYLTWDKKNNIVLIFKDMVNK